MLEDVPVADLVTELTGRLDAPLGDPGHDLDRRLGADEVDLLAAAERLARHADWLRLRAVERLERRRRQSACAGEDDAEILRSLAAETAMALQTSAHVGHVQVQLASALHRLPEASALLRDGEIGQRVLRAVADSTATLPQADVERVDAELASALPSLTVREARARADALVEQVDPHAALVRTREARRERHVRAHPRADVMSDLVVHAPAEQVEAAWRALDAYASARRADGDDRTVGQIMSDTAVERLTGQARADDVAVEVGLLIEPGGLFGAEDAPALMAGYGPVPAPVARELSTRSRAWLRRLFTDPAGTVLDGDPRRRRFDGGLAALVRANDQRCSRPWCDCRVREIDHVVPYADGGPTRLPNARGVCRPSHRLRDLPGWRTTHDTWTTPTGHRYGVTRAGPLPGPPRRSTSPMERRLATCLAVHRIRSLPAAGAPPPLR